MNLKLTSRHNKKEITAILKQQNLKDKYLDRFIAFYDFTFKELYEEAKDYDDLDWEDEEPIMQWAIKLTCKRASIFINELTKPLWTRSP